MELFGEYRRRRPGRSALIESSPASSLFNVVVIPCYDEREDEVAATLEALAACRRPRRAVEVIVVINAAAGAAASVLGRNRDLYRYLTAHAARWTHDKLSVHPLLFEDFPPARAGVGLARKTGMDEALRRLERAGTPEGIITSLDADTRVDQAYLTALEEAFLSDPRLDGVSLCFEHPLEGDFPAAVYEGILQYELHLRYFVNALRFLGYPYAYHTIGSAFAVRARAYAREGGMNTRQGGEDFYFLQKIIRGGRFADLTTTCVRPSPRPGDKVPFGTGPEIRRFVTGEKKVFLTYNLRAFLDLEEFFAKVPDLYERRVRPAVLYRSLPLSLQRFLKEEELTGRVEEIMGNVASSGRFMKRFFRWFDTFRVIRYLNGSHPHPYSRQAVQEEARRLLIHAGREDVPQDLRGLLMRYRETDRRQTGWRKTNLLRG